MVFDSVQIDSSQGEPFYAEIPFRNAQSQTQIEVVIEQHPASTNQTVLPTTSHFNTYVRQNPQGDGLIIITSSRPILERDIQLLLRIKDGNQTRLQQIRSTLPSKPDRIRATVEGQPLQPRFLVNEQDHSLDLPMVTDSDIPVSVSEHAKDSHQATNILPLKVHPETAKKSIEPEASGSTPTSDTDPTASSDAAVSMTGSETATDTKSQVKTQAATQQKHVNTINQGHAKTKPQKAKTVHHKVKANESLWSISAKISELKKFPINLIMQQIQHSNPQAFINNDPNYLKQGAILSIPDQFQVIQPKSYKATHVKQIDQIKNHTAVPTPAKTRLDQAHMSILTSSQTGEVQGGSKLSELERKALQSLVTQIHNQRKITLRLQGQVREIDEQLRFKESRITMLNARLAELEKQLKAKKKTNIIQDSKL